MRLVDADELKAKLQEMEDRFSDAAKHDESLFSSGAAYGICQAQREAAESETISATPTAVRAKWIAVDPDRGRAMQYICSNCGGNAFIETYMRSCWYDRCPRCGAYMDDEQET